MTTHAQKADAYLEMALSEKFEKSPAGSTAAALAVSMAQVHATLALVEQQRATNLVLLLTSHARSVAEGTLHPDDYMAAFNRLNPDIVAALGLTEES